jgi:hypothetical protein
MKFSPLQVVESKHFGGLLMEENLGWLGINMPTKINEVIEPLYDVMLGADNYVNFLNRLPIFYIEKEGDYQWSLSGQEEKALTLVKATSDSAGSTSVSATSSFGLGGNVFYLWFNENYFNKGSQLHGLSPEKYKLIVVDQPIVSGTLYGYKVQPVLSSETDYVPYQELLPGIKFAEMGAIVENEFSRTGNGIHFASNNILRNTTSTMRKEFEMSGSLFNRALNDGSLTPMFTMAFSDDGKPLKTKDGGVQKYWIDAAWWQFLREIRRDKAMQILYGSSNKMSDGTYFNRGVSGNVIRSFSGLYEQMNAGNYSSYNVITADAFTDFCMQISVGKIAEGNRKFMVTCGEWGAYALSKAIQNKANANTNLRFTHNVKPGVNTATYAEMPYTKLEFINGIELDIVIDPYKDNEIHNQQKHPLGGTKASYDYDIFAMGDNTNENIQIIKVKQQEDYYRCIEGMRSPYTPGTGYQNPTPTTTELDGFKVMWMGILSARIKNPIKTGRLVYNGTTV